MGENGLSRYKTPFIIAILVLFSILVLWIRLLPLFTLNGNDILNIVGSDDPLYNLRQIESMTRNFPAYGWFDAMTLFPTGNTIHWGPLFIWIISAICIVAGAATRPEIIQLSLAIPPVMAVIMIPVIFLLVRKISDWKTGLFAAGFITVVAGQYFFRSLYGYLDHHIAEVLFSTIFSLAYISALGYMKKNPVDLSRFETLRIPLVYAVLTGIAFILGLYTMPTMILFALIVTVFTVIQFVWDFYRKQPGDYLLILNAIVFGMATTGFLLIGVQTEGMALNFYTIGHPLAYLMLILGTAVLWGLSRYLREKGFFVYTGTIVAIGIVAAGFLFVALPEVFNSLIGGIFEFFGQNALALTVQEARSWTVEEAWATFNWGLVLMAGGFIVMILRSIREERPDQHYVLIWSAFILISAWQHIRYEYFLAVNIAILSGICIGYIFNWSYRSAAGFLQKGSATDSSLAKPAAGQRPPKKGAAGKHQKAAAPKPKSPESRAGTWKLLVLAGAFILALLFVYSSLTAEYQVASSGVINMNPDWRESLEWMGENTPDTGVDYYTVYNKASFTYPATAYGVMSWWDYGHMITYIAKRIPNANPFQAGVAGPYGSAAYFMADTEDKANAIADHQGTRYVITDIEMDTLKFWAMATWFNATLGREPYQKDFLIPDQNNPNMYVSATLYGAPYYESMVSRLHNFDGSEVTAGTAVYVEYEDPDENQPLPAIIRAQKIDAAQAVAMAAQFNRQAPEGRGADVVSSGLTEPITNLSALRHYRLVHESPSSVYSAPGVDLRYVKVFEYVRGAVIRGDGTIELPVVSDAGRRFTYRQKSVNGTFVVPYSTAGSPYGVKATGKYRITGTGREFDVSEDAVRQGTVIA